MDTRLKSKALTVTLIASMLYLWAVSMFAGVDFVQHKAYLNKNYYFNNYAFTNEIEVFSGQFQSYYIEFKNYSEKRSPADKLGPESYNELKKQFELTMKDLENNLFQSYMAKITQAQKAGDTVVAAQWTEERDLKLAEAKRKNDLAFEDSVNKMVAYKDQEYTDLKHSLDIRSDSIKYYIRNVKTKETYSNIDSVPPTLEELKDTPTYRDALFRVQFPLPKDQSRSMQWISQSFVQNQLEGILILPFSTKGISKFQSDYTYFLAIRERILKEAVLGVLCLAVGIALFLYLRKQRLEGSLFSGRLAFIKKRIPLDVRAVIGFIVLCMLLVRLTGRSPFYLPLDFSQFLGLTTAAIWLGWVFFQLLGALRLLRNREELRKEWEHSLLFSTYRLGKESLAHKNLLFKIGCILALTVFLGFLLGITIADSPPNEFALVTFIYFILYLLFVVPIFLRLIVALNHISKGTEQLAAGNFHVAIPENGSGQLALLAQHLNNMRFSFQQALEDRMKSERMKSELITNVSHDLKTPLTSIINYVDLLKRESITPEETTQYIEVLDRKTQRLKVLIDDLFEASKMASGAVELELEKVDVAALLHQALAEFSDKIEASTLTFRVNTVDPPIYARLDGKKTWRVFENLISNVLKYSLPNTRVYITLAEQVEDVILTIQNISAYEIDFEVGELFERFKRGDQSRHTEGSGLGLAIAKSIVELQGGQLRIEVDGDQFKAIILFQKQ